MAWWLMAPGHYLNHCWYIISGVLKHSHESSFPGSSDLFPKFQWRFLGFFLIFFFIFRAVSTSNMIVPIQLAMDTSPCMDGILMVGINDRADSRFAPSQWEMALLCNSVSHWLCNSVSHWLGASLGSALNGCHQGLCLCCPDAKLWVTEYRYKLMFLNPLWPNDAIWRHRSRSTLAHVTACWLTALSHYWTNIDFPLMRFCGNFTGSARG